MKRILSLSIGLALALSYSPLQAGHGSHCHGGHYHGGSSFFFGFSPGLAWSSPYYSYPYRSYGYYPSYSYYRPRYAPVYGYAYDYRRPAVYARPSLAADVQIALATRGYYYGNIDGIIGSQSRNAIRRYQVRYGLPVTGAIDYPLMRSLALR
jgi:hypothetical protein